MFRTSFHPQNTGNKTIGIKNQTTTPSNAPKPAALELFGQERVHAKNKISPTSGIKKPKTIQPIPPLSLGS